MRFPHLYRNTRNRINILIPLCGFILLFTATGVSQSRLDWKARIDFLVDEIDSLSLKSQTTFHVTKYLKNLDTYKETWYYTLKNNRIVYFEIRYVIGVNEFTEIYYVDRNLPICMEQYETPYKAYYMDELIDGKMFFLDNNSLKLYVSLGRKQTPTKNYPDAETACLNKFEERYKELQKTMQYLK